MSFSEAIKTALHDKNMTPSELARKTGYTPQYIHSLLIGKKRWNETTLGKTCEALGLEINITDSKEEEQ